MTVNENINFTDYASGIRLPNGSRLAVDWKNCNNVTIFWNDVIAKFSSRCFISLVKFSYWSKFHFNIITGSGVMQLPFISDWPEIRKSEIPPSEFCLISTDWSELRIPNLARTSLRKSYWMLQNARVTDFTVSELLREYQQERWGRNYPHPPSTHPDKN